MAAGNSTTAAPSLLDLFNQQPQCNKPSQTGCVDLGNTTCFGSDLPYSQTSFELVTDADTLAGVKEKLLLWSGIRAVPLCWDAIQPLLCSVYFPECGENKIQLIDRKVCQATRQPCKIVEVEYGWPDFLRCDNNDVYADQCESPSTKLLKFNASGCEPPLMATTNPASYYDGVDGCGLQCMNPLFNEQQHVDMHVFIAVLAGLTCICTLFAMLSFFVDWKNSNKYPARIIFYINLCFFMACIGWLAQFFSNARNEIVCRRDGTMRLGEPVGTGESPSCIVIFVLVYFFLMAGIIWFDILSYSWFIMYKALNTRKDPLVGKTRKFHLAAWCIPFVLVLACLGVSQVDGDSMSGICFIGYKNHMYRVGFLLVPVGLVLFIAGFFLLRGLAALFSLKNQQSGLLSDSAVSKITWTMARIGIFTFIAFVFVFITFAVHVYELTHQALWEASFRDFIKCEANVTILETLSGTPVVCELHNRPSIALMKLNLVALFGTGIAMSTWVWTRASALNWRRFWFKLIGRSDNEMKRIRHRSRMIAKAFANRHARGCQSNLDKHDDEIEYSEHTFTHQDPLGMNFDLHSVSQEMSSSWVRNVPNMVKRRGGMLPMEQPHDNVEDLNQPGLWAVSQYIDGPQLKQKSKPIQNKRNTKLKSHDDTFIGTSPYNYRLDQPKQQIKVNDNDVGAAFQPPGVLPTLPE
uniref:Protein smoothened n=1 Tax=Ciona intestinalis TaxID=7719 RepID=Q4H2S9_CIOIN|nr:smoothened protein [Ciona intestinalis]BAE06698.1 smoothened [Ciona intestinalis]|eukprot:NP_001071819.1 smoothened protein [Ciona intestinalis]